VDYNAEVAAVLLARLTVLHRAGSQALVRLAEAITVESTPKPVQHQDLGSALVSLLWPKDARAGRV